MLTCQGHLLRKVKGMRMRAESRLSARPIDVATSESASFHTYYRTLKAAIYFKWTRMRINCTDGTAMQGNIT